LTARGIVTTSAYVLEHNKRRLLILLGIAALVLFFFGIRNVFEGFVAFLGSMPALVIQLLFLLVAGIAQFAGLMWFLSRPRTYSVSQRTRQVFRRCGSAWKRSASCRCSVARGDSRGSTA